jgi:hypothetical protein
MPNRTRILAVASAAALAGVVVAAALAATAHTAPGETAAQAPLPELGHWRSDHVDDDTHQGWLERMDAAESSYGNFAGHWHNYHQPGAPPPMTEEEIAAAERGERLHIAWKPRPEGEDWAYTASGAYDDTIDQVMTDLRDNCGPDCWLSIEIEPENKVDETAGSGYTAADFRGLWERVAASRERMGADNVKLVWVVMSYEHWRPLYDDLWPGNDVVDVVGQDPYIRKDQEPGLLAEKIVSRTRWLVNNSTPEHDYASKPFLIAEYGCDINAEDVPVPRGTARHRANCIEAVQGVVDELGELGVVEMEFYDARSNRLDDPPAVDGQAYLELKQFTEGQGQGEGQSLPDLQGPLDQAIRGESPSPQTAVRRRVGA